MVNPTAIEKTRQGKRFVTERLYERFVVNEPFQATDTEIADRFRVPKQDVRNARVDLVDVGSLQHNRSVPPGSKTPAGRWLLTDPKGTALAKLEHRWRDDDKHTAELMAKKNASKGVRYGPRHKNGHVNGIGDATPAHPVVPDVLVASSGPEPVKPLAYLAPDRKDEAGALIEASRQYARTNRELDAKVKEMEALTGTPVDRVALGKLFRVPHDHSLLIVSKVMPYVEQLERANARLTDQNNDLREKAASVTDLHTQVSRLREQNQRLIAETTALRNAQHARTEVKREPVPNAPAPDA